MPLSSVQRTIRVIRSLIPSDPWKILTRSAVLCALIGLVLFGLSLDKIERLPLDGTPLAFDASRAHETMRTLAKTFPNRLPWHENRIKAGDWLKQEFRSYGYEPREMVFSTVVAGKRYANMRNIYVEKKGTVKPDEIVMVLAHYDTADTTVEGAMDDASGVGVVLELARVFSRLETRRSMIFLATDSEEFGAFWGARTFARQFPRAKQIVGALSFDFLAAGRQVAILNLHDGLKQGYTPLWLREIALDSIRSIGGVEARDMMNFMEFIERAILIPPADHGALLAAGIPALNWVGQTDNFAHLMAHYHHTHNDVAEAVEVESFQTYGAAAERFLRSMDHLDAVPENFRDDSYLKVSSTYYIEGWVVTVLHLLFFVPFLFYSLSKFGAVFLRRKRDRLLEVIRNEAKNLALLTGSLLIGYGLMRLLPELKIITEYEVFPATQKSALLYSPDFLAMILVLGTVGVVYWAVGRTFAEKTDSVGFIEIRHAFHGILLTLVILAAFLKNSHLAVLLLLPPAYFWTFLKASRLPRDRVINMLLLLGGTITLVAMILIMTTIFHVGVAYWYFFLSATYGLFSAYAVVLFLIAIAIMYRLFRSFIL